VALHRILYGALLYMLLAAASVTTLICTMSGPGRQETLLLMGVALVAWLVSGVFVATFRPSE